MKDKIEESRPYKELERQYRAVIAERNQLRVDIINLRQQQGREAEGRDMVASAVERASRHADATVNGWTEDAYHLLLVYMADHTEFMMEEFRTYARRMGFPDPPDGRAWAAPIMRAKKNGLVRSVGLAYRDSYASNASPRSVWEVT